MAKKTTTKKSKRFPLGYLTVFKQNNGRQLHGAFAFSPSIDAAKEIPFPEIKREEIEREPTTDSSSMSFKAIQNELAGAVSRHRSLNKLMGLLDGAAMDLQFSFSIRPVLMKHATLSHEDPERSVYSFNPAHFPEIMQAIGEGADGIQGINQLPGLLLIGLVSEYDNFLRKLIRVGLSTQPALLSKIDRAMSLKEISQFSSISDASEYLLEKEIDEIMYQDHFEQLVSIGKLFNANVDTKQDCVKAFMEICERRNLFTHNAGCVNARYLHKCKEHGVEVKCKIGDILKVDSEYFVGAVSVVQELSIKLSQFLWRKLVPADRGTADSSLNHTAYELLRSDEYDIAEKILDYGLHHAGKGGLESMRRMMAVNYALAIKLKGDQKRANAELDKFDWSATSVEFQISVAAVRSDLDLIESLMPEAARSEKVGEQQI
ncbi:hypothetical protein, partial [Tardiphaga sp.]|uniref:hypothetical protein n=1 Tax=Tardiphaga sp. TaxID=1926292 RepID=UPI0037D999E1